jgi:hypothetical protein
MLALLIRSLASGEITDLAGRVRTKLVVYSLVVLALLCGAGFLVVAAYVAAARRYGDVLAASVFGGFFIVLALIILGIHAALEAARAKRRRRRARSAEFTGLLGAVAAAALPSLLRSRIGLAELLAPVFAVAAYEIYKENTGRRPPPPEGSEDTE